MSQNVEERKKCNRELAAEDGCLNSAFTLNKWFVKVRPCYGIGKVCFSFVLKTQKAEEKGKISFDVYMDMDEFDNWCDDILDRTMAKQIALERKNSADKPFYTFTTGENGSYKMSFGFSTVSDVNICGKGKHKESGKPVGNYLTANVPVNYSWLRTLAKYYRRTSAASLDSGSCTQPVECGINAWIAFHISIHRRHHEKSSFNNRRLKVLF